MDSFHIIDVLKSAAFFAVRQGVTMGDEWLPFVRADDDNYDYLRIKSVQCIIKPESTQVDFVKQLQAEVKTTGRPHIAMGDLSMSLSEIIPDMATTMFKYKKIRTIWFSFGSVKKPQGTAISILTPSQYVTSRIKQLLQSSQRKKKTHDIPSYDYLQVALPYVIRKTSTSNRKKILRSEVDEHDGDGEGPPPQRRRRGDENTIEPTFKDFAVSTNAIPTTLGLPLPNSTLTESDDYMLLSASSEIPDPPRVPSSEFATYFSNVSKELGIEVDPIHVIGVINTITILLNKQQGEYVRNAGEATLQRKKRWLQPPDEGVSPLDEVTRGCKEIIMNESASDKTDNDNSIKCLCTCLAGLIDPY